MWKKWMTLLLGVSLLAVLTACSGDTGTEDSANDTGAGTAPGETAGEGEKDSDGGTSGSDAAAQLGLTAEKFQEDFNRFAEEEGIAERMETTERKATGSGGDHEIVDLQFDDDRRMQLLAKKGEDEARAVMFSSSGDRADAIGLIRVLIRTVEPDAAAEEVDGWLETLGFNGSAEESDEFSFADTGTFNLMVEDGSGFLQFVIANADDPDITTENFEAGEL